MIGRTYTANVVKHCGERKLFQMLLVKIQTLAGSHCVTAHTTRVAVNVAVFCFERVNDGADEAFRHLFQSCVESLVDEQKFMVRSSGFVMLYGAADGRAQVVVVPGLSDVPVNLAPVERINQRVHVRVAREQYANHVWPKRCG